MSNNIELRWAKCAKENHLNMIGSQVLAYSNDDIIVFLHLVTQELTFYRANGGDKGDGINCVAGHRFYEFFAFAERSLQPRILILSYPHFTQIENTCGKYIGIRFSLMEYIVALTGYPSYKLKIWNFRFGELLLDVSTEIKSEYQLMKISNLSPFIISQYASDLGILLMWEIHASGEKAFFIKRPILLPSIDCRYISLVFFIDGLSYMSDGYGNLYLLTPSNSAVKLLWEWNAKQLCQTQLNVVKGGFIIFGIFKEVKFIKKLDGVYTELWNLVLHHEIVDVIRAKHFDMVYFVDVSGDIKGIEDTGTTRVIKDISKSQKILTTFEMIYPDGTHILGLTKNNSLLVVQIHSGDVVLETSNIDTINCLLSHPNQPVIVFGYAKSVIEMFSFRDPENPKLMTRFVIGGSPLVSLKFSSSLNFLIIVDDAGEVYIIKIIQDELSIVTHFQCNQVIFDYTAFETSTFLSILILPLLQFGKNRILRKESLLFNVKKENSEISKSTIELPKVYCFLCPVFRSVGSPIHFIAVPVKARQFDVLEMRKNDVILLHQVKTNHQVKFFKIYSDLHSVVTYGLDGIVCVFDLQTFNFVYQYFGSNRLSGGLLKSCCTPDKRYGISLTKSGCTKCLEIKSVHPVKLETSTFETVLKHKLRGYEPSEENPNKVWLLYEKEQKQIAERTKYRALRTQLLHDFNILKEKLLKLLNDNEAAEEIDKVKMNEFNLYIDWGENVRESMRKERENEERLYKAYIDNQNAIAKWIIDHTWNKMVVKSRTICGIFSKIIAENFGMVEDNNSKEYVEGLKIVRKAELKASIGNSIFFPWTPRWITGIVMTSMKPEYATDDLMHITISETSSSLSTIKNKVLKNVLSGTTTHNFIDSYEFKYWQFEVVSFFQMHLHQVLCQFDISHLKEYFNKQFEDMFEEKKNQMRYVKERNDRLRYIDSELRILDELKGSSIDREFKLIEDPQFCQNEISEAIIKVEDWELKSRPYISPSRQRILDDLAYEEHQRLLALLADDFRERALIVMMDGVLERRWEDDIKKDPPLPECKLKNKDPFEYTKEDIRAVQDWEKEVKFLEGERDKYTGMLLDEKAKTQIYQNEQITKFNLKCGKLFLLKTRVDAAIKQEELNILRPIMYNSERDNMKQAEKNILSKIQKKSTLNDEVNESIQELEKLLHDCRIRYDQLLTRDKLLDKQFKSQFAEFAQNFIVEQAYKIFKKRPKRLQRAWATAAIMTEMAARIMQRNNSRQGYPLPEECYEYLNAIDALDNYNLAPNIIDVNSWGILCRMRRQKLESEFKVNACGAQLAEADASLKAFTQELYVRRASLANLDRNLIDLKQVYKEHLCNRNVQIVLPFGQVEVPLTGKISTFDDCLLLHSTDVEDINEIIKRAGKRKLATMRRLAVFRRQIIYKEWEHKMLQMTMKDMETILTDIRSCKVTIEMREWLKHKKAGRVEDLSEENLLRKIKGQLDYLGKIIADMDEKIEIALKKLDEQKRENTRLDKKIINMNIALTEKTLERDVNFEEKMKRDRDERMNVIVQRSKLIKKVQANHAHILELATMLELQRLRTYPTLEAPKNFCP